MFLEYYCIHNREVEHDLMPQHIPTQVEQIVCRQQTGGICGNRSQELEVGTCKWNKSTQTLIFYSKVLLFMQVNVYVYACSCFFMHVYLINSRTNFKTMLIVVSSRTKYMHIHVQSNPDFSNLQGQGN